MAKTVDETLFIDYQMSDAFDWSDSEMPVRDAIWDYLMEKNSHDTLKTEADMKPFMTMAEADVRDFVERILRLLLASELSNEPLTHTTRKGHLDLRWSFFCFFYYGRQSLRAFVLIA